MLPLPQDLMEKVSSLKWLTLKEIKEQFQDYMKGYENCERVDILRSIIAYRIQERHYNISVSPQVKLAIEKAGSGSRMTEPVEGMPGVGKRIKKTYRGKTYEAILMDDKSVELDGTRYASLTAAAKAITGTHWNGRTFFGLK